MQQNELKAGALFAGIGGFCLGFAQAGIKTVWAVENNLAALQTYQHNINNVRIVMDGDVPASVKNVGVESHLLDPVDVLHAGFPCQSFSMAGERKGFEDDRGVNRRAILSRLGVETASNSFHLSMSPSSVLAGGIWSVLHGYDL